MKKIILIVILLAVIGYAGYWMYENRKETVSAEVDQARALDVKTETARKVSVRPTFSLAVPATIRLVNNSTGANPTHVEAKFSVRVTPENKRRLTLPVKAYVDLVDMTTGEIIIPAASLVVTSVAPSGMTQITDTTNGAVVEFTYLYPIRTLTQGKVLKAVIRKFDWYGGSKILPLGSSSFSTNTVTY